VTRRIIDMQIHSIGIDLGKTTYRNRLDLVISVYGTPGRCGAAQFKPILDSEQATIPAPDLSSRKVSAGISDREVLVRASRMLRDT
jgi:hypothetical protein